MIPFVGQTLTSKHTLTQDEFDRFAALSGDNNPIHLDPAFSARTRFGKTVAHGMFLYGLISGVLSRTLSNTFPLSQDLMFPAPSYVGDEITICVRVLQINSGQVRVETTTTRPNGEVGCQGEAVLRLD